MPARSLALLATLLLSTTPILAGCIGKNDEPEPIIDDDCDATETCGEPVVAPNETFTPQGQKISAFDETNATETGMGGMAHDHDYWAGEPRKIILQEEIGLVPLPLTPEGYPPGTSIADFNIPAPALVYEGTSQLELLFTNVNVLCSGGCFGAANPAGGVASPTVEVFVDYITADDDPGEWRQAGKVTPDAPLIVPVKPLETDMPHSVASLWLFRIYTSRADAFDFNLTITAVKGNAVANWPPHPDLYAKGPERVIYDGPWETKVANAVDFFLTGTDSNWYYPERVISYGTDSVRVEVTGFTYTPDNPAAPAPTGFYLDYYNASFKPKIGNGGTSGGSATDPASDGTSFLFTFPVTEYGYDSPYGTKSRWAFRMLAQFDEQGLEDFNDSLVCTNCLGYSLKYNLKIVAVGHSTAEEGIDASDPALDEEPTAEEPTQPTASARDARAPPALPALL